MSTLIEKGSLITEQMSDKLTRAPYREVVGCLMYLAVVIHPDIAYTVNFVSQFLEKPSERHWMMIKRILRYLQSTTTYGIRYRSDKDTFGLIGYSNADFANDIQILEDQLMELSLSTGEEQSLGRADDSKA